MVRTTFADTHAAGLLHRASPAGQQSVLLQPLAGKDVAILEGAERGVFLTECVRTERGTPVHPLGDLRALSPLLLAQDPATDDKKRPRTAAEDAGLRAPRDRRSGSIVGRCRVGRGSPCHTDSIILPGTIFDARAIFPVEWKGGGTTT